MSFCTKCGVEIAADFAFCSKCGQPNAATVTVDDFTSRVPVREILNKNAPWAIPMFERRLTGADFMADTAVANLMGLTRMNSSGEYHSYWCIIGEKTIGLFNDHGTLLYKEKGWAVSFLIKDLWNVKMVPGRTSMSYSNGETYVADYWILHWPISGTRPMTELKENSTLGIWKQANNPIYPHLDVWCNSKKDPLYERWVVVLPFEESGDPALRNKYAESLAKQINHLTDFQKNDSELLVQNVHLKTNQGGQSRGWFSFVGDIGGD